MVWRIKELEREHGCPGDVQLWTLTIDPGNPELGGQRGPDGKLQRWADPRRAYDLVRTRRRIGEWARTMGITYYVVVVEWQENGMPHWHLLIWSPVARLYLQHKKAELAWGLGYVLYRSSVKAGGGRWPPERAVNYVTKYLTKPKERTPEWVMDLVGVQMIYGSAAWGAVVREDRSRRREPADPARHGRAAAAVNRVALANCRQGVRVLLETVDATTGQVRLRLAGHYAVPWRAVRALAERLGLVRSGSRSGPIPFRFEDPAWERLTGALRLVT